MIGTRNSPRARVAPTPSDAIAALTRRLAAREETAFREFHALYFDRLYQFLLVVARGQEYEAREALQETMLRVARRARVFDQEEHFWCWLKTVARNTARDGGRKESRYRSLLVRFLNGRQPEAPEPRASDDPPLNQLLAEALAELPVEERRLLEGKYLEGATVRELSIDTGLTVKAIESRLLRLRRHLRETLIHKLKAP